jgi:hypothetical protein
MNSHLSYLITSLIAFWVSIFSGLFVLYKRPKERANQIFSLWAFMVAIVAAGDFLRKISNAPETAFIWAKIMMFGVIFLMPALNHLALLITPRSSLLKRKYVLPAMYIPSLAFLVLLPTDLLIAGVTKIGWRYSVVWGSAMLPFAVVFAVSVMTGTVVLIRKVWLIKPINYYFLLFGLFILIGLVTNFVPFLQPYEIPTISPLAMGASILFAYVVLKHKFIIIPTAENTLLTKPKYSLEAGHIYLVKEEQPETSFSIFVDLVTHGYYGMCISRKVPEEIREKYNLRKTPIFWLTEIKGDHNIFDVQRLVRVILSFLDSGKRNSVILLHGLEYLITHNGFSSTLKALHFINDYIMKHGAYMITSISPLTLDTQQLKLLEAETYPFTPQH